MGWFQPSRVSADLDDVLVCRYVATPAGRHDLIPDGCLELLWIAGGGVVLCGPDTHAWSFELPPGTVAAGVRFRPGAAAALFRLDAVDVKDERVGLGDVVGSREARIANDRLAAAGDPSARFEVLEALVRRRLAHGPADDMVRLAALVGTDPAFGIERLAGETGVSSRQLRRRFDRHVGYGPAFLARIARLQRFAHAAARRPAHGLAQLASAAGYVDQAHLAKDCRTIAGATPRQLVDQLPRTSVAVSLGDDDVRSVQDAGVPSGRRWVA